MAELLNDELKVKVDLIEGGRGEFTVWVDDKVVANKVGDDFPAEDAVVTAVRKAL